MWHIVGVVVVCMAITGQGGPVGDTARFVDDSLPTAQHHDTKVTKALDDSSSHSNPSQAQGISNTEMSQQKGKLTIKYPDHSKTLPHTRVAMPPCDRPGPKPLPNPEECRYFVFCNPLDIDNIEFQTTYNICEFGYSFDRIANNCIAGDCQEVALYGPTNGQLIPPLHDPVMGGASPPSPSSPQVPKWFDKTPAWFDETPWWFKTPPSWFHNPPVWFNSQRKSHVEVEPGFDIERPDQIIKNVGTSNETSSTYYDEKTLRINIPIKIVQQ